MLSTLKISDPPSFVFVCPKQMKQNIQASTKEIEQKADDRRQAIDVTNILKMGISFLVKAYAAWKFESFCF